MDENAIATAAELLKMTLEETRAHSKPVPEANATYFWNPRRGGNAVLIAKNGEKLAATSAVCFEKHLQAFLSGKRN